MMDFSLCIFQYYFWDHILAVRLIKTCRSRNCTNQCHELYISTLNIYSYYFGTLMVCK